MPTEVLELLANFGAAPVNRPVYVPCHYCANWPRRGDHETTRGGFVRCRECAAAYRQEQGSLARTAEAREYGSSGYDDRGGDDGGEGY